MSSTNAASSPVIRAALFLLGPGIPPRVTVRPGSLPATCFLDFLREDDLRAALSFLGRFTVKGRPAAKSRSDVHSLALGRRTKSVGRRWPFERSSRSSSSVRRPILFEPRRTMYSLSIDVAFKPTIADFPGKTWVIKNPRHSVI